MKKVLIFLILFSVACSGPSEESSIPEDTTTTTIPPIPTIDFDIVEIYNTKLGKEICIDATEIDVTSEECLRQYRDNLETVFSYAENLEIYINELNTYFETYPSEMTDNYKTLFEFVDTEYERVSDNYRLVVEKYTQRFGGAPELYSFEIENLDSLSVGCSLISNYEVSENLKYGSLTYRNNTGEIVKIYIDNKNLVTEVSLTNSGGEFKLESAIFTNYLNEEFITNFDSLFYVNFSNVRITKVYFDKEVVKLGEKFKIYFEWENPKKYEFFSPNKDIDSYISFDIVDKGSNHKFHGALNNYNSSIVAGGYVDSMNKIGYIEFYFKDIDVVTQNLNQNEIVVNPIGNPFMLKVIRTIATIGGVRYEGYTSIENENNPSRFNFGVLSKCIDSYNSYLTIGENNIISFEE